MTLKSAMRDLEAESKGLKLQVIGRKHIEFLKTNLETEIIEIPAVGKFMPVLSGANDW